MSSQTSKTDAHNPMQHTQECRKKKTTRDCTREKTCYLHDEFIRTDVFSSKSCCTYELNLMLHCLVADRDNTKHNAIYRFISS